METLGELHQEVQEAEIEVNKAYAEYFFLNNKRRHYTQSPEHWEEGTFPLQGIDEVFEVAREAGIKLPNNSEEIVEQYCNKMESDYSKRAIAQYDVFKRLNSEHQHLKRKLEEKEKEILSKFK